MCKMTVFYQMMNWIAAKTFYVKSRNILLKLIFILNHIKLFLIIFFNTWSNGKDDNKFKKSILLIEYNYENVKLDADAPLSIPVKKDISPKF